MEELLAGKGSMLMWMASPSAADDAKRWAQAAADPEFQAEAARLWTEFVHEDTAAWEV